MVADDEFITIVPVGEGRPPSPSERDPAFVTVLTVGAAAGAAEVLVRRPRGARLGLGLKFEGGSAAAEKVRRLLVQSCATDSPAANATTPWGKLIPGDEILAIDGAPVSDLTRIDCVRRLKDSDEALKLLVRHLETDNDEIEATSTTKITELHRPTCLPPPVPPRKLNKKNSFKERPSPLGDQTSSVIDNLNGLVTDSNGIQNNRTSELSVSLPIKLSRKSSFDSHIHRQAKESIAALKKSSPEEVRRLVRRLSDGKAIPPEAEVYMDLLSQEWERCLALADAESDDTGSSISTVVDRLGSIASSVDNSIPSTPIMQPKTIDIQKVLNCIENIDSDLLKDIATTRFVEKPSEVLSESRTVSVNTHARSTDEIDSSLVPIVVDETVRKKIASNDKNNNNTLVRNITCISIESSAAPQVADRPKPKMEAMTAKPRPMPRSTKPEPIALEKPTVEVATPAREGSVESEVLLTPTKKNCIENWLQRSEAELVSKRRDGGEETAPEALPRLIDFVPKLQFRSGEMKAERVPQPKPVVELVEPRVETRVESRTEVARLDSTSYELTPPPPESREDGSGASLDTIGELDEGTDTTATEESGESEKNAVSQEKYDSAFWEGRTNRSDVEDNKSLSNDETPPTCPRQPPDGVETPCDAVEKMCEGLRVDPPPPTLKSVNTTTRLPSHLPPAPWSAGRGRTRTSYSRSQDARSECSVKDKIAMFSLNRPASVERVDKCGLPFPVKHSIPFNRNPSPAHKSTFSDVQTLDRRLTKSQDNLDEVPRVDRTYRHADKRPEVLGAHHTPRKYNESTENKTRYSDFGTMPLHYGSTTNLIGSKPTQRSESVYHARSISDDGSSTVHKSTLEYIIEQRKKSMSKLRGLMIPEMQGPIIDLPEIKVQECNAAKSILFNKYKTKESNEKKTNAKLPINLNDSWKINLPNNIPKYSPAFKRKSLQVYPTPSSHSKESTPERKMDSPLDGRLLYVGDIGAVKPIPTKPPRTSIDIKKTYNARNSTTLPSSVSLSGALKLAARHDKTIYDKYRDYENVEVKVCTTTDIVDSDNDSAVSSTQSSYRSSASSPLHNMDSVESDSSHLSPRSSHYISYSLVKTNVTTTNKLKGTSKLSTEYEKRSVCRSVSSDTNASISSSAGSVVTSGSQASCSSLESSVADSGKKKVTRTHSVDTINRRNILASAKCRSGRDLSVGSPVVETKFTHESPDRSPSPQRKTSDRLTTLASGASGLSNKGESRRIRSKVIADTDSDSEGEVNIRQRKSEFKTARLKKNSTKEEKTKIESTRKQVDTITDNLLTTNEVPQIISQRIIKEIKKAGLHDVLPEEKKHSENNNSNRILTTDAPIVRTNENGVSNGLTKAEVTILTAVSKTEPTNNDRAINLIKKKPLTSKPVSADIVNNKSPGCYKVCLKKGVGAGVGLILAGGVDCEAKAVTVHKVLAGSVAEREGLQRGVRVRSINGRSMDGLSHAETVAVLKESRNEVIIEIEEGIREAVSSTEYGSDIAESKELERNGKSEERSDAFPGVVSVTLEKCGAGAGLGFGLDGGKDSPSGDRPLTIKKLFAGGAAARSGHVLVGSELVSAGGRDMRGLTRTQAWAALKELPTGPVVLLLRNPC